ncbi:MAG: type II secretion system protein, partial [Planctomycetota bacterium]
MEAPMLDRRPADHRAARRRPTPQFTRAFTLLELLVSLAVIGVLIGILAPALSGALGAARDAVCLSNQKQIAVGWVLYGGERQDLFPSGKPTIEQFENTNGEREFVRNGRSIPLWWDWGGVDWYRGDGPREQFGRDSRPLNSYIGGDDDHLEHRAEIFQCPRDDGLRMDIFHYGLRGIDALQYNWGDSGMVGSSNLDLIAKSGAEDAGRTAFSVLGTSYRANDWIWAEIGYPFGYLHEGRSNDLYTHATDRNRHVDAEDPSRFVITGDWGSMLMGRIPAADRDRSTLAYGWWHGVDIDNIAFLDGSARRTRYEAGQAATAAYSFYFDPDR